MKNVKLSIESHKKANINTISYFVDKIKYVKDSTHLHKLLKEKLKDRHRIKGAFFSAPKKNDKFEFRKKKNKDDSFNLLELEEANYLLSLKNYDKLRHELHLKEKKEKAIRIKEKRKIELFNKEINYTTLKETIYQFLRFKKNSNLYRAKIKKNKMEIKLASKISKKNKINQTLKNVILHFNKVKEKVDLGKKPMEETENEYAYKKLVEQIAKSRLRYMRLKSGELQNSPNKRSFRKSIMILNRTDKNSTRKSFIELFPSNSNKNNEEIKTQNLKTENIETENIKTENIETENILTENIITENKVSEFNIKDNKANEEEKNEIKNNVIICKTENNESEINNKTYLRDRNKKNFSKKKIKKNKFIHSDKAIKIDINSINNIKKNYFENDSRAQRFNNINFDTQMNSQSNNNLNLYSKSTFFNNTGENNPSNNLNILNNNENCSKILNTETNNINDKTKRNENNSNSTMLNKSNDSLLNNKQYLRDLSNLEKMRKNNLEKMRKKKNPLYWNTNIKRLSTAGCRTISKKVINKPFYVNKIGDFVREYNRIKSATKKSRIAIRENPIGNNNEIEKIFKTKEDLLMFNLKFKFFNCHFPQKKQKAISKKLIFKKKLTNCMEIIEDPFNIDFEIIGNEMENDNL